MTEMPPLTYPPYGVAPSGYRITACEVLCWIGYRRPIPTALYYAPVTQQASGDDFDELGRRLHDAVPDPKPQSDPMGNSEAALVNAIRQGKLTVRGRHRDSQFEDIPDKAFRFAVVVNAHDELIPDIGASMDDWQDARSQPAWRDIRFVTDEVLAIWPPDSAPLTSHSVLVGPLPTKASIQHLPKKRGTKSLRRDTIAAQMVQDYHGRADILKGELEKTLESKYAASRDTCRRAADLALDKLRQNSTIDK